MTRTLLISRENGRVVKTYGVKKVKTNMKFFFIISVISVFLWCGITAAESRIINDLKYLEYLNDLDRRNVELDDIHKQWPFVSIASNMDDEDADEERIAGAKDIDRERLLVSLARAEIENKHQNYRDKLFGKVEGSLQNMRDMSDRADQLSQFRRYKPYEQDILEEARMYPERNEEEDRLNDDDTVYQNSGITFADPDEELSETRPIIHRPFFPRIAAVETPMNYENTFRDSEENDEPGEEPEEEINIRPSFPKAYFPRIAPVDIPVNYKIDDIGFGDGEKTDSDNNHMHDEHEEYKFKEGEEFPSSKVFDEVPVVKDPSEFGFKPSDPRFYMDAEEKVTAAPKSQDSDTPYQVKTSHFSKPKMNSRSDLHKQRQKFPTDEIQLETYVNKDVEVVPFKPEAQEDTAGVYVIAIIAGISAAATVGLIAVGIGWYNLQKHMKNAEDTDYPSYGIVGPNKSYEKKERNDAGDRRLAQSAQMYHYQHQKQQIIAMGRNPQGHGSQSDTEEEEDEEGNYTVYECPGLASIEGPLEVKNPMFDDDQLATPSQTPLQPTKAEESK